MCCYIKDENIVSRDEKHINKQICFSSKKKEKKVQANLHLYS